MNKHKQYFKYVIFFVSIIVIFSVCYICSDCYKAKKLVLAIKQNDVVMADEIISENSECINCFPSVMPRWWRGIWDYVVYYPLQEACYEGNYEMVVLLLEHGADPNITDDQVGVPPLYCAFYLLKPERFKIAWALIETGADINAKCRYTLKSVFIYAGLLLGDESEEVLAEQKKVLTYFLKNSSLNTADYERILLSSAPDNAWFVKKLIEKYPDLLSSSRGNGVTPLMIAAYYKNEELVKYLLEKGVDAEIKDEDGKTAYDYALEGGNSEIAEQIKAYCSE